MPHDVAHAIGQDHKTKWIEDIQEFQRLAQRPVTPTEELAKQYEINANGRWLRLGPLDEVCF